MARGYVPGGAVTQRSWFLDCRFSYSTPLSIVVRPECRLFWVALVPRAVVPAFEGAPGAPSNILAGWRCYGTVQPMSLRPAAVV